MENLARWWQDCNSAHCLERLEPRVLLDIVAVSVADKVDGVENYYWTDTSTGDWVFYDYKLDGYDYTQSVGGVIYQSWFRNLPDTADGYDDPVWWDDKGAYSFTDYEPTGDTTQWSDGVNTYVSLDFWLADTDDGFENHLTYSAGTWQFWDYEQGGYWKSTDWGAPFWIDQLSGAIADFKDGFSNYYYTDGVDWQFIDMDSYRPFPAQANFTVIGHENGSDYWSILGWEADYADGVENWFSIDASGYKNMDIDLTGDTYVQVSYLDGSVYWKDEHWYEDASDGFKNNYWVNSYGDYVYVDYDQFGYDYYKYDHVSGYYSHRYGY